ncbi:tetratricopeptide repeat protein [candidate division KSB1 bacterium]|nr:tetratricopeptide repeat protein [candidate division KSB1 bacterium]RQW05752.1 MAG: tetratricopeptide repeat protein [candidate division KSB1 bacterium]
MKSRFVVLAFVLLSIGLFFMACQTKEVTSAKVYIQQDNWDKAIEQLEMAVSMYPNDAEAHYLLGEGMAQKQNWERMNDMFDKSLAIAPTFEAQIKNTRDKNWVNQFNAGVARLNNEQTEAAMQNFKTAVQIDPSRSDAYKTLAITYTRLDSLEKAKENFNKVLGLEPDNKDAINGLANIHFQLKEYRQVVELEKKTLEMNPEDKDAIANLALAYDFLGETEMAKQTYIEALKQNPGDKDLIFNLARLHFMNNQYDEAIELFNQVLQASPDDFDANTQVGNAYLQMGDEYRKSLVEKEDKNEEVTKEERDRLIGFYEKAIPYIEKAVGIMESDANVPVNSAIYNNLGVAYINIGNREKGELYFKKAEEAQ